MSAEFLNKNSYVQAISFWQFKNLNFEFFVLSFFPLDVLGDIWDVIESVSEGFLTYSWWGQAV